MGWHKRLLIFSAGSLFLESVAFLVHPFQIPNWILRVLYPQFGRLSRYCLENACLYDPISISSLYTTQALLFVAAAIVILLRHRMSKYKAPPPETFKAYSFVAFAGISMDYLMGNFSFSPTWLFPNHVTDSHSGLFRYAFLFSFALSTIIITSYLCSGEGGRNVR